MKAQVPDADAQVSGHRVAERVEDGERQQRMRKRQRQQVRVPVVDPAPRERAGQRHRGQERIGQVQRREQHGGDDDAGVPSHGRLRFTQEHGVQGELLAEAPQD